nr:glycosyltransferase family 4 protein [Aurantiacibacter sp. 219JJ12-13]MDP5263217.1 glycosyltransferase family 4 protein [Aurantiacibacter sp. 219JJ12-13]
MQSMVQGLAKGLEERGHEVVSLWSEPTDRPVPGKRVMRLHLRQSKNRPTHLPSLIRSFWALLRARPQVVHVHFLTQRVHYFLFWRRLFGFRVVLTAHGSGLLRPWPQDAPHLGRFLREADEVTAVSPALIEAAGKYEGVDAARIAMIPNGIDTEFFSPAPTQSVGTHPALVSVGRLDPVKGHDVLIRALPDILDAHPETRLVIVGDGECEADLRALAEKLNVAGNITFAGSLGPGEIRDRLQMSDLFVLPSRSEGMPVALLEAMACGVPCVASEVGGVAATVADAGVLVPSDDPKALGSQVASLLADDSSRQRLAALARSRAEQFALDRTVARYEEVYEKFLA